MENSQKPTEAPGLSAHAPQLRLSPPGEESADFVPLRLVLQPSGASVEVNRSDMIIGRHSEADIRVPLPDVSRRHCQLVFTEGCWQVIDLNSLNGIQVNGVRVSQALLQAGDLLKIGGFTFVIELSGKDHSLDSANHVRSIVETLSIPPQRRAS